MKFEMAPNSLFAILLRSPWWVSLGVAAGIVVLARVALPAQYFIFGAVGALPFLVIGSITSWRQMQQPSAARVSGTVEKVTAMAWPAFSQVLEAAYRRDGYVVTRITAAGVDLEMTKDGRKTLVGAKRWKAARAGIEPMRELVAARERLEADEIVFVATGPVTEQALQFAVEKRIRVVQGPELTILLRRLL